MIFLIVSSGSPLALIAWSLRSTSKKALLPHVRVDYWRLQLSSNFGVRSAGRVAKFPAARPNAKAISPSKPAPQGDL